MNFRSTGCRDAGRRMRRRRKSSSADSCRPKPASRRGSASFIPFQRQASTIGVHLGSLRGKKKTHLSASLVQTGPSRRFLPQACKKKRRKKKDIKKKKEARFSVWSVESPVVTGRNPGPVQTPPSAQRAAALPRSWGAA